LVREARKIGWDTFAESPYMERAIDEGLSADGGKIHHIKTLDANINREKGRHKCGSGKVCENQGRDRVKVMILT
jgi:hypothetical protein